MLTHWFIRINSLLFRSEKWAEQEVMLTVFYFINPYLSMFYLSVFY